MTIFFADDAGDLGPRYANTNMSSPVKDTPPTFAEQQMLEKQRRYSQLLEDEGSDEIAQQVQRLDAKVASQNGSHASYEKSSVELGLHGGPRRQKPHALHLQRPQWSSR